MAPEKLTPETARRLYLSALSEVAPDADLAAVRAGFDVRLALRLDEARFRLFLEHLGRGAGFELHYDDADADCLRTLGGGTRFLVDESARVRLLGMQRV